MYTCISRVTIVLASDCSSKTTGRTMTSTMALTILHSRLNTAELNSSSSHVALVRITMRLIPRTSTLRHRKSRSTTDSTTRAKATQRSQPLFNAEVSPSHASRASAQRVRRDCIRYFYQISDLTAFVIISGGNPGDRITTAEGKNPAPAITIGHAFGERHQSLRLAPVSAGQCPAAYRTVASLSVSRLQDTKKNYTPSTSSTSPSKLGVKTPLPRFSKISSRLQKRPPSSSSLGTTSPSYTVRWT